MSLTRMLLHNSSRDDNARKRQRESSFQNLWWRKFGLLMPWSILVDFKRESDCKWFNRIWRQGKVPSFLNTKQSSWQSSVLTKISRWYKRLDFKSLSLQCTVCPKSGQEWRNSEYYQYLSCSVCTQYIMSVLFIQHITKSQLIKN